LRSFPHHPGVAPARIEAVRLNGRGLEGLVNAAHRHATWAANHREPLVFAPPIATFANDKQATEADLAQGLVLSIEADERPAAALEAVVSALGIPTLILASGGTWTDPDSGEVQNKLHVHYRLRTPTGAPAEHAKLKRARRSAALLTGADPSTVPTVHPLRWAGSLHRKDPANPKEARIVGGDVEAEIDLDEALQGLEAACRAAGLEPDRVTASGAATGERQEQRETGELIQRITGGTEYHAPLVALSARYAGAGMTKRRIVDTLRGFLEAVPEAVRDLKDGERVEGRWRDRWDSVEGMAASAVAKFGPMAKEHSEDEAVAERARPKLVLVGGQRRELLREIEAALRDPTQVTPGWIFSRGLAPAVLRLSVDTTKLRIGTVEITLPPRTAYLAPARPEHLAALLDDLFRFVRFKRMKRKCEEEPGTVEVPCDCPLDLARHVLANVHLLPLLSISRTPVLRHDGSVLDQPGYDAQTGIYYAPEIDFPATPEQPTQEDARAALERLMRPFRGFPFTTEADRAAVAAEQLTLFTRHLVPRAPGFLHHATEAGSGKTKLFDTVSFVALGAAATLHNAEILEDEAELKKMLTTLTLAAVPLVIFDNVARGGEIASPGLSNFLTATIYGDRLLGSNEEVKAATCTMVGMTGNGCEIAGDNTRRILRIDLDPKMERPELRAFDFDCEEEALRDRGELVAAALTILKAHALAGWPGVPGRAALGSYEKWDRLVCGALVFAGAADLCSLLEKTRTVDPERGRLVEVLHVLVGIGATSIAMRAGEIIRVTEEVLRQRTGKEERREAEEWLDVLGRFGTGGKPGARSLGRYLAKHAGRVVDGLTLLSEFDAHAKVSGFRVKVDGNGRESRTNAGHRAQAGADESTTLKGGSAGFAGLCGASSPLTLSDVKAGDDLSCRGGEAEKARITPRTPQGEAAPIGKCRGCGFLAPLNGTGRCGLCEAPARTADEPRGMRPC
jgi:putative DNA primase/helicase